MRSQVWKIKLQKYSVCAYTQLPLHLSSVQSLSRVWLFAIPWTACTSGLPVHHQLPEFTQTHVHCVSDAIQPSHPLSSPSPPAFNLSSIWVFSMSQFFTSGGQSIGVSASTSVLPMNIQDWFPLGWTSPSRKDHTSVPSESHIQLLYGSGFFGYPYLICIYNLI